MDVSQFLGGSLLTQADLPAPFQTCTISQVEQRLVGQGQQAEQKICISLAELPSKSLGLNKTNLRRVAELYGTDSAVWIGKQLLVYRSVTDFQGRRTLCVRVCGPQQVPTDPICDQRGNAVDFRQPQAAAPAAPAPQAPVAAPQPTAQPVASPQQLGSDPWQGQQQQVAPPAQKNSPPSDPYDAI